ncbi:sodium-dependent proline transporter-like [Aedes albopictus]|uniref:Transporter n=1 Tax=Aedes albopictus TaxID=7160 RepID=A0ABM1XLU4_AEDAL
MRGSWASKTEFILSCLGYAIGIGNVWRFPYLCYRNGGGAFLIPYLIMLVFCGIPLFFLEVSLGQFSGRGCVTVFQIAPLLKGAGLAIVLCNFVCVSYCNVIMAYSLLFLWNSLRSRLPWMNCGNKWNTERCLELGGQGSLIMNASARWRTSADEFFQY